MENNEQIHAVEAVQDSNGIGASGQSAGAKRKKGFSVKLFAKLLVISILLIAAAQLYSFDAKKNSGGDVGKILNSIASFGNRDSQGNLSNSEIEGIIKSLVPSGTDISVKDIIKENGLYKLNISVNGKSGQQDLVGFLTLDGKKFFPQVLDVAEVQKQITESEKASSSENQKKEIVKSDKPKVELFVMSHCPYGTQVEKGMLPVAELLKDKIDFSIKFVDYAMHGEKEVYEELNQYCIQKEQPQKYNNYLKCFLKDGNSEACLKSSGIDMSKLKACTDATDKAFSITDKFKDKSTWSSGQFPPFDIFKDENSRYGVQGSPTLVINEAIADPSGRDSKNLLATVCSAFTNQPSECSQELSSAQPSAGFGDGASGTQNNASCGN